MSDDFRSIVVTKLPPEEGSLEYYKELSEFLEWSNNRLRGLLKRIVIDKDYTARDEAKELLKK